MMQAVLKGTTESPETTAFELTFGMLLLDAARKQDRLEGALHLVKLAVKGAEVAPQALGKVTDMLMRQGDIGTVRLLLSVEHKAPAAASIAKAFSKSTLAQNPQQQHEIGLPLKALFEGAAKAKASEITAAGRQVFITFAQNLGKLFSLGT
jgi:hypothetical protein